MKQRNLLIMMVLFLSGCCTVKNNSKACQCKEYNKFVRKYWLVDEETGKNYIDTKNANVQISSMDDFKNISDCWIGKTTNQVRKMLPNSTSTKKTLNVFEIQPNKELHDCRFKGIGCKPIHDNAMAIRIRFKKEGKIGRVEIRPSIEHGGGKLEIELFE